MHPQDFAKEFVNDFLEDLNKKNFNELSYSFNKTILTDDPGLCFVNKELNKIGYKLLETYNNEWKAVKL